METSNNSSNPAGKNLFVGNGMPDILLLRSMRDLGYNNIQMGNDIIDNSIDALPKDGTGIIKIKTDFECKEENKTITFIDHGCGMTLETLSKALVLGGDKERNDDDLGKFKVGLKASALSVGKNLKIITKAEDDKHYTGIFDYDEALSLKTWNFPIITESSDEDLAYFKENLQEGTGTIVILSKLDRLSDQNGKNLNAKFVKNISETFRNFISTSNGDDNIKFYFNDKKLTPIDPMCRDLADCFCFNSNDDDYEVVINKKKYHFKAICYHVPFISEDTPEAQSNMRHTTYKNSGFYFMRNNRQIDRAQWIFTTKGEDGDVKVRHATGNQFRAELIFNSDCDEIFKTDTKKMSINLPQQVIDKIDNEVGSYLRGVQIIHAHNYGDKTPDEVLKALEHVANKMNNKISTPTVLRTKNEKEIPSVIPPVEPKNGDIKKREHPRNKNKKVEFTTEAKGIYAPFLEVEKRGIKKYWLEINRDHVFYSRFAELDKDAQEFALHFMHALALTLYSDLYDIYNSGVVKDRLIKEFLEKLSKFFRADSE